MSVVPAPYPPQALRPDPLAVYGRTDEAGNGPVEIVQTSPAIGDTIVRNSKGEWVNTPAGVAVPGGAVSEPAVTTAKAIQDATKVWSEWKVPMAASTKLTVEYGPTEAEVSKVKLEYETPASCKQVVAFRLPPGWWVKLTSASLGQPVVVTG